MICLSQSFEALTPVVTSLVSAQQEYSTVTNSTEQVTGQRCYDAYLSVLTLVQSIKDKRTYPP